LQFTSPRAGQPILGKDKFNRQMTDKYLETLVKKYPKVDLHILEYIVASYSLYDVEKQENPEGANEDFIKGNQVIEELIEQKKEWTCAGMQQHQHRLAPVGRMTKNYRKRFNFINI
jgi:hypothetical protein